MSKAQSQEERRIHREIHRLFWKATLLDKPNLIITCLTRWPALLIYNMLIPVQIAYGLQAIIQQHFDRVHTHAINILLLAIAYSALWAIGGVAISRNGRNGGIWLQKLIFANFLNKDYEFYSNTFLGALGTQAIRFREVYNEYSQIFFLSGPNQTSIVLSGIIIIASKSWLLALVTLTAIGLVLSMTIASSKYRMRYRREVGEASSEVGGYIGDALTHATAVKSFANEDNEKERLNISLKKWGQAQYTAWVSSIPADVIRMLSVAGVTALLLLLTANLYRNHSISIAIVALVQLYVIRLISSAQSIGDLIKIYETAMGAAYQPVKTMLIEPQVTDSPTALKAMPDDLVMTINFKNVRYRYPEAKRQAYAIQDFSLTINEGEKIGLVGYSGSGKTTLTKLLLRFMDVSDGTIEIAGENIKEYQQALLRNQIAYVPQEPILFHRTVAENISYGRPEASEAEVLTASQKAYVDEFVRDLPSSYETIVGERGIKLSGGQRQRVAIARALLKNAPILVLDEATSALDSESERYIQEALWRLMEGRTALVIAHRLSTIQRMDRIIVMDKGRIVQQGTHTALLQDKTGIYATLWAHQSGGYLPKSREEMAKTAK